MLRTVPIGVCWKIVSGCINNVSMKRSIYSGLSKILFSAQDKDLPIPTLPTSLDKIYNHDTDILLEQFRKAKSMSRVLELISMHIEVMNDRHISTCFGVIHDKLRDDDFTSGPDKLTNSETFQALCNRTMHRSRFLQPDEVIAIFKTLSTLGVKSNTYVMQAMLKMLCSHLNDLNLNELTFLNFLLSKQRPNALVSSLQLALPLVLQVQINQQLDSENLNEVVSSLKMACKARLKPATIQKVISALQSKVATFSPEHATNIIFSLFSMETPADGYMQLIKAAFDIISNDMDAVEQKSLLNIVRSCRKHGFYYRSFFLNLSKRAVSERWELPECYELINSLHRLSFFSPELLNLISQRIISNPEHIRDDQRYSVLTLSEYYTFADYQVYNVHNVIDALSSAEDKVTFLERSSPHLYFKLITSWTMLGCIQEKHLSAILDENFLFSAWSSSKKYGRSSEFEQYVYALQWSLENLDQCNHLIPSNFMKAIKQSLQQKKSRPLEYPLARALENGLGGSQFFLSGIHTRGHHFIDHVLAMRSGSYPVSLSTHQENVSGDPIYIDDLQLPDDAKIISIIVATKEDYCMDPCILKGLTAVKIKNLARMSYSPIVINYENWTQLTDREKIPYLMKEIRQVMQTEASKLNIPL